MGDLTCDPSRGNISFGSGKGQWAFTLRTFARIYSKKFEVSEEKMMGRLWGDNFYDPISMKWKNEKEGEGGAILKRGFVQYIIDPIINIYKSL